MVAGVEVAGYLEQCLVAAVVVEGEALAWDTAEGADTWLAAAQAFAYAQNPSDVGALACGASDRDGHRDRPDSDVAACHAGGTAQAVDALLGAAGTAPTAVAVVATAEGSQPSPQLVVEAVVAAAVAATAAEAAVVRHDGSVD